MKKDKKMQIVIFCGGLATRLGEISNTTPKSLININNKPFILYQLEYLKKFIVDEVILCVGHLQEKIIQYIQSVKKKFKFKIIFSIEKKKLGTGGALVNTYSKLRESFVIMYGDSYLNYNLNKLNYKFSNMSKECLITVYRNKNKNYLNNILIENKKITNYNKNSNYNFIDYGIIFLKKKIIKNFLKKKKFDLSDVIKYCIRINTINYSESKNKFHEIGSNYGIKLLEYYLKKTN